MLDDSHAIARSVQRLERGRAGKACGQIAPVRRHMDLHLPGTGDTRQAEQEPDGDRSEYDGVLHHRQCTAAHTRRHATVSPEPFITHTLTNASSAAIMRF